MTEQKYETQPATTSDYFVQKRCCKNALLHHITLLCYIILHYNMALTATMKDPQSNLHTETMHVSRIERFVNSEFHLKKLQTLNC